MYSLLLLFLFLCSTFGHARHDGWYVKELESLISAKTDFVPHRHLTENWYSRIMSSEPPTSPNLKNKSAIFELTEIVYRNRHMLHEKYKYQQDYDTCLRDILLAYVGLADQQEWAIWMFDASGKEENGLAYGNVVWLTQYDECKRAQVSKQAIHPITGEPVNVNIKGNNCHVQVAYIFTMGICVPESCSAEILNDIIYAGGNKSDAFKVGFCEKLPKLEKDGVAIAASVILAILGTIVLCGTALDYFKIGECRTKSVTTRQAHAIGKTLRSQEDTSVRHRKLKPVDTLYGCASSDGEPSYGLYNGFTPQNSVPSNNCQGNLSYISKEVKMDDVIHDAAEDPLPNRDAQIPIKEMTTSSTKTRSGVISAIRNIMVSFSLYTNVPKILSTKTTSESMGVIQGIRVLTMSWVVLGHLYLMYIGTTSNLRAMGEWAGQEFSAQAVLNATVSTDTFFVLSGLLTCYLFLKKMEAQGGRVTWQTMVYYYVHRYWRLTPFLMIILMIYTAYYPYIGDGPFFNPHDRDSAGCRESWWRVMLYITNFLSAQQQRINCMAEIWYLCVDMQIYVVAPLFLIPLCKLPVVGLIISFLFFLVHFMSQAILQKAMRIDGDKSIVEMITIYRAPWCRVGAYMVGAFAGYVLYRTKRKMKLNKIVVLCGWVIALFLCGATLYGQYKNEWDQKMWIFYKTVHRPAWSIGVAWIIVACVCGYGGFVNTLLSMKVWIPLARVSYAAYLLHMKVLRYTTNTSRDQKYFSNYNMICAFLHTLTICFALSFVASVLFEAPFLQIEKFVMGKARQPNGQNHVSKKQPGNTGHLSDMHHSDLTSRERVNVHESASL